MMYDHQERTNKRHSPPEDQVEDTRDGGCELYVEPVPEDPGEGRQVDEAHGEVEVDQHAGPHALGRAHQLQACHRRCIIGITVVGFSKGGAL